MFGMVIETGPKFYMVPFPTQKVTDSEFLYKSFVINVLQFQTGFALPVAIIAKCEEKIFLAQKTSFGENTWRKNNSPLKNRHLRMPLNRQLTS